LGSAGIDEGSGDRNDSGTGQRKISGGKTQNHLGPQFLARDFEEFIRISGMTHVRTSPFYPQSNGKLERWYQSLKTECIRPLTPLTVEDARRLIQSYVDRYNTVRLHSAIGYVTPQDMLAGRQAEIHGFMRRAIVSWKMRAGNRNFVGSRPCPRGLRAPALELQ
jgi:hypothetical protein